MKHGITDSIGTFFDSKKPTILLLNRHYTRNTKESFTIPYYSMFEARPGYKCQLNCQIFSCESILFHSTSLEESLFPLTNIFISIFTSHDTRTNNQLLVQQFPWRRAVTQPIQWQHDFKENGVVTVMSMKNKGEYIDEWYLIVTW